ncbi:oligosaccharide flippase family protein [Radiobacillus sp. PE A8.2]|uniref:putative polysaccharide biosynthesis protein n=1 Tax=Radiobacillus sp. PE A8.2 TaxID=3380349 RepID=UPI00388D2840
MSTSNVIRGTVLLSAAGFVSKILGMLYVIPFQWLVGEKGAALFLYAYTPYVILLSISIAGVPKAVSKFVAKYNALGDYETGRRMFKAGISLLTVTGFIGFLILFFSSEALAISMLSEDNTTGNSLEDVTMVIQMVSFALILIPGMSIVRGFFQGHESMGPTALSQVVEQIARIVFLLVAAFLVIKVFDGTIALAVGFATFGTFIGAIFSCVILYIYWIKRKPRLDLQLQQQKQSYNLLMSDLMKELFRYAGPFVLVAVATPLYQLIDQFTFNRTMTGIGYTLGESETMLASFNFYSHKLVIIPVTLALGLSMAMLPAITKAFTEKKQALMIRQMNQSFQIIALFIIPAVVGLSLLAHEAYGTLFGLNNIETYGALLAWYAPAGLFFALFTVSSNILQGIDQQKFTLISLIAGLLLKIVLNVPFMHLFGAKGAIITTLLTVATVVILNMWRIHKSVNFSYRQLAKRTMLIVIFTAVMGLSVWLVKSILGIYMSYTDGVLQASIILIVSITVGLIVYLGLCYYSTLLEKILGNRVRIFDKFLKR